MALTTYKRIAASAKTLQVFEYIGTQRTPPTSQQIAAGVDLNQNTVMTHLATLEDAGWIEKLPSGYRMSMKIALLWARKKSMLEHEIDQKQRELQSISE